MQALGGAQSAGLLARFFVHKRRCLAGRTVVGSYFLQILRREDVSWVPNIKTDRDRNAAKTVALAQQLMNGKVEVWAGGKSGRASVTNKAAGFDALAYTHQNAVWRQMGVSGDGVIRVQDADMVGHAEQAAILAAVPVSSFGGDNGAGACRQDRGVFRHGEVDGLLAIRRVVCRHRAARRLADHETTAILKWQAIAGAWVVLGVEVARMKAGLGRKAERAPWVGCPDRGNGGVAIGSNYRQYRKTWVGRDVVGRGQGNLHRDWRWAAIVRDELIVLADFLGSYGERVGANSNDKTADQAEHQQN